MFNGPRIKQIPRTSAAASIGRILGLARQLECMWYKRCSHDITKRDQYLAQKHIEVVVGFRCSRLLLLRSRCRRRIAHALFLRRHWHDSNGRATQTRRAQFPIVGEYVEEHLAEFFDEFVALLWYLGHRLNLGRFGYCQGCVLFCAKVC